MVKIWIKTQDKISATIKELKIFLEPKAANKTKK